VHTSSPTSSISERPMPWASGSDQALTLAPRQRHCISPATTGSVDRPPMKAPANRCRRPSA
jgi:hypothetical protein